MDEDAKRRLVGAAVLVALMVIFVPMLVDHNQDPEFGDPIVIPNPPAFDRPFDAPVDPDVQPLALPRADDQASVDLRPGAIPRDPQPQVGFTPSAGEPSSPGSVAAPAPVPPGVESWVVQVASLSAPDAAQRLQNELRQNGYPAFIEQAKVGGTTYYRVRVGPEVDRARAERLATDIKAQTGGSPLVQQYR
jgi:DedD protein